LFRKYGNSEIILQSNWIDRLLGYISMCNGTLKTIAFEIDGAR